MSTNTDTQSNKMEFEINNQLGDPDTLADISEENQESGTWGQNRQYDENAETQQLTPTEITEIRERPISQTPLETDKNTDIYTILQQLLEQQLSQHTRRMEKRSKKIEEQIQKQSEKKEKRLALQAERTTKQLSQQIQEESKLSLIHI